MATKGTQPKCKMLKWTVEFSVAESWVADGFDLTNETAKEMIEDRLGYAYPFETTARVIKAPSAKEMQEAASDE